VSLIPDSHELDQRATGCATASSIQADISSSKEVDARLKAATAACAFSPAAGTLCANLRCATIVRPA
jgi:hypothetical protein